MAISISKRSRSRQPVRWVAQWGLPTEQFHIGEILDATPEGLFVGFVDGSTSIEVGSEVELIFVARAELGLVAVRGTVRWLGRSDVHSCEGFGVELREADATLSAYFC